VWWGEEKRLGQRNLPATSASRSLSISFSMKEGKKKKGRRKREERKAITYGSRQDHDHPLSLLSTYQHVERGEKNPSLPRLSLSHRGKGGEKREKRREGSAMLGRSEMISGIRSLLCFLWRGEKKRKRKKEGEGRKRKEGGGKGMKVRRSAAGRRSVGW